MPTDAIDRYHKNMFDFDQPNARWVTSCAAYLDEILPGGVAGKRVVDYGFGRGNWSLAFLELGAAHVTAIDASQQAVDRFAGFARAAGIENLSVELGNSDEQDLQGDADIVFLYGILHHVKDPLKLLRTAGQLCAGPQSTVIAYAYNADSLRQTTAEIGRAAIGSDTAALRDLTLTLHPDARIRAMDDLTAPCVFFWSNEELAAMLGQAGLCATAQAADFAAFEGKSHAPEFEPYVLLASPNADQTPATVTPQGSPNPADLEHLTALSNAILATMPPQDRVKFAVGLFNTSFAMQGADRYAARVFDLWRYLVLTALTQGAQFRTDDLPTSTRDLFDATRDRTVPTSTSFDTTLAAFIARGGFRL